MAKLPTNNWFYRLIWTADSIVSTAVYETWAALRGWVSGYSSWLYRWFHIGGIKRLLIDAMSEGVTLLVGVAFGLLAYALPDFDSSGDVWNRGRQYAITFTDPDGKVLGKRGISQNDSIPINEFPPVLIKAVLATEDARFYEHMGIDIVGTLRAIVHNSRGGSKQGGSSITQQVVKNLLLTPEKTYQRKVHEAFLALWTEERLSKNEILKLYLDRSYLGGGNYGVEAASQFYFGKSVRDINLPEAAVLAGLFKAPTQYAPHANQDASRARTDVVLYRMLDAGYITQGELLQAKRNPAQIVQQDILASPNWYLDWAYQNALEVLDRQNLKGEYVVEVKTTMDKRLQDASQAILDDVVDNIGPKSNFEQAASITMAPDGAVKAIVGGRNYEDSQFNRAITARRQVGSSFKPFVYLTALEHGYTPDTIVEDGPVCVGDWCVHNFDSESFGRVPLWVALTHSINTVAVKLMLDVGRKNVEATAHRLGVVSPIDQYPTMAIGTSALTLMDMTTGYSSIAADGKLARPYAVQEIRRPNGDLLYSHAANEKDAPQVDPANKVEQLIPMMHQVVMQGTATRAKLDYEPVAGKTGTNANFRDAWFIGFSAHNVTGVWVGNDDNSSMNSSKGSAVTGGLVPAPAWKRIMDVAEFGLKPAGIPGVPMDASWKPALTTLNDPALVGIVAGATQGPVLAAAPSGPAIPDAEATAAIADDADQADPQSRDVLNGMLDLFQDGAAPSASASGVDAAKLHKAHTVSAPRQQRSRSFFDLLFGKSQ